MNDRTVRELSTIHTFVYRTTNGRLGRRLVNNDMLLLTTVGRSTGRDHTVPLLYLREGDRLIVIASYGGRQVHPEWYRNLRANPLASVQILGTHHEVVAMALGNDERSQWWPRIVDAYSDYAVYQSRTDREIPVIWLDRCYA